ncbi:hypothetical protein B0H11DRAFT_2223932 [Mycena galericulata]|nr:hypothetical protein B0H11DRAFT_2223932 [Mycena galericulata]
MPTDPRLTGWEPYTKRLFPHMSTGGRKVIRKMIYDDEAEEDNAFDREHDSDAERDGSEGGRDGHVNEDEDMEEETPLSDWDQTARGSSDVELSGSEEASTTKAQPKSPKKNRSTTPLQTRSRAAKQALPTKELDTTGHATSHSDKAARIQTGPVRSLKGTKSVQKTLNVRTVKRTTDTSQGDLNVSADEYQEFLKYKQFIQRAAEQSESKADDMDVDKPDRGRPPQRVTGKSGANSSGKAASPSKRKTPTKRKQSTSGEEHVSPPSTPAGSKKTTQAKASDSKPSPKKAKTSAAEQVVLQTEDVKQISKLPKKCQVTTLSLQDPSATHLYKNLPNLESAVLDSWSADAVKNGNITFAAWEELAPGMKLETLYAWVNFVQKDNYVNMARVNPMLLKAVRQIYGEQKSRWSLCIEETGAPAICIMSAMAVKSSLTEATSVIESDKAPRLKFLTAVPHSQEYERMVGALGMLFQETSMKAQIFEDTITFGTRPLYAKTSVDKSGKSPTVAKSYAGIKSTATRTSNNRTGDTLSYDDDIPVYDGRTVELDVDEDVDDLASKLPLYEEHGGEVPNGACVVIGHTVTQFKDNKGEVCIGFNIRWVVVLGQTED